MRGVRRFAEADIPQVADLHRRTFEIESPLPADRLAEAYRHYLRSVFCEYPGHEDSIHPLVFENDGAIVGFLGVVARRFCFRGRPVRAAVCTQFVVDKASRGLPGLLLLKTLMKGEQDFSFADECNDASRALWMQLGATTVYHQSVHWYFPVRPVSFAAQRIGLPRPIAAWGDALVSKVLRGPFATHPKVFRERAASPEDLAHFHRTAGMALTPEPESASLQWMLSRAAQLETLHGKLEGAMLVSASGEPAGCFLYHGAASRPSDETLSKVVHFAAAPQHALAVLHHLFQHARERGVAALGGRVPPEHLAAFSRAQCSLYPPTKWFVAHSRDPEIAAAVCRGDFQFTPLHGEWCCHFNYRSPNG